MAADVVECCALAKRVALRLTDALTDDMFSKAGVKIEHCTANVAVSAHGNVVCCSTTTSPLSLPVERGLAAVYRIVVFQLKGRA